MSEPLGLKFWRYINKVSVNKIKENWADYYKHDRRCLNCNSWQSETGDLVEYKQLADPMEESTQCSKCHFITVWGMEAMLPYVRRCYCPEESINVKINNVLANG